uniref:WRKY transcription factor n=1 Tax=Fagopyrum tataricum TaxID=62330 RepID=A0A4P9Q2W9_FAGTA|nr:WRKY transcription factor [Fagopyrum tataricum]
MLQSYCKDEEKGMCSLGAGDNLGVKCGGSIAERRAAKFGFDASKINTSRFKSSSALVTSPASPSPYLLRTPGISPGALLESPMMLPNLQPSPTTGAFPLPHLPCESGVIKSESSNAEKDCDDTSSFTFNPHGISVPLSSYSAMQNQYPPGSSAQNSGLNFEFQHPAATLPPVTDDFEFPTQFPCEATGNISELNSPPDSKMSNDVAVKTDSNNQGDNTGNSGIDHPVEGDQRVVESSAGSVVNSEDGYNWRKYGQKQVKASEFPRSYYKCTHPNCPVKKKVEHSGDGLITEIVYKGAHNHPKPQPNKRSTFGSSLSCCESSIGYDDLKLGPDRRLDGLDTTCSTSITTENSNPPLVNEGKSPGELESEGTPERSSTLASNEENEEDTATEGNMQIAVNGDDEPDLKRRKMENSLIETALASRAIREPRVIVQIESEVDILDDGYRWRKYGQKVVKGNPNPRSYYKCTHPGCPVRKHVERASHNLKFVLTTYEGKHNHEVPSARNSSHGSSGPQEARTLSQTSHFPKSEPQSFATHSNRRAEYNKDFIKPNYVGNFAGGPGSLYQMKIPSLPNNMVYGAFGVNPNCESSTAPVGPTAPMSSNMMAISTDRQGRPVGMIHPMFFGQPPIEGDVKLLRPMQD